MSITTTVEVVTLNTTGTATKTSTADGFVQDTQSPSPSPLRPSADAAVAGIDTSLLEAGMSLSMRSMLALVVLLGAGVFIVR